MEQMKALLVEDDRVIAREIARVLEREGFQVQIEHDGERAIERGLIGAFGIIILDVMLPGQDGMTICRELRSHGCAAPVLMLTARDAVDDKVLGLEAGADDYLPKPFDARELVARVRALLRRDSVHKTAMIRIADLEIDTAARSVRRGGREIRLTPREYTLLEALARNEGRTLTREVILESVWGNDESLEGTVNYHVASLRKKVDEGFSARLIQTIHGFGYSLRRPETGASPAEES
jgi:DNA-binding response OmpR family regulator